METLRYTNVSTQHAWSQFISMETPATTCKTPLCSINVATQINRSCNKDRAGDMVVGGCLAHQRPQVMTIHSISVFLSYIGRQCCVSSAGRCFANVAVNHGISSRAEHYMLQVCRGALLRTWCAMRLVEQTAAIVHCNTTLERPELRPNTVSYTHLTLPTTPYV